MKISKIMATSVLLVSLLGFSALADTVGSPVVSGDGPKVASATDAEGNDISDSIVTTSIDGESDYDQINDYLASAKADLEEAGNDPTRLPGASGTIASDLDAAVKKIDSSLSASDLSIASVFDASYVNEDGDVEELGAVTITFEIASVTSNDVVVVVHNYETGKWEVIDPSKVTVADGKVTVTTESLSPFAVLVKKVDPTATPTATPTAAKSSDAAGTTSPQTGEHVGAYVLVIALALATAGVVCFKRAKATQK